MALSYVLEASFEATAPELLDLLAEALRGTIVENWYVRCDGMDVTPEAVEPGDRESTAASLGFTPRTLVIFTMDNLASPTVRASSHLAMVEATLELLNRFAGDAVLLLNDEYIVLQRLRGPVTLNVAWEALSAIPSLARLAAPFEQRVLPQPYLGEGQSD